MTAAYMPRYCHVLQTPARNHCFAATIRAERAALETLVVKDVERAALETLVVKDATHSGACLKDFGTACGGALMPLLF